MFKFFKPAPHVEPISDQKEVDKNYRYWRFRIFYGMYIGYIFYYFTRKSFTFAMPALMRDLGFDKADLGLLASVFAIAYGFSKFLSGVLADRSNPRYFMAFGLIITGILNVFFGLSSSITIFVVMWGLNGWFQGWGWPPCARLLTHWYSQNERGRWWGFWNTSHSVGGAVMPLLAPIVAAYLGWRYAMYVPGAMCIAVGLFLINRLRDTPQSLGLPSIEEYRGDYSENQRKEEKEVLSTKEILWNYVLKNPLIWILGLAYIFVYVIRTAVNDWTMVFLVESKGYSEVVAGACVVWFEIGGIFGSLAAGWISDKIFNGRRGPVNVLFSIGMIACIALLWIVPAGAPVVESLVMFSIGFMVFGPQMLIGMAAAELSHKKAAGTATGFVGWLAYLGAAVAGYPLGKACQEWGWYGFFIILGVCATISVVLLLPLWSIRSHQSRKEETGVSLEEPTLEESAT